MSRPTAKKEPISRAALELFVEKGIEATTTREIALKAGAGEGTMFRHYLSKEDLAWRLYDENLKSFLARLEEAASKQKAVSAKVTAMTEVCYDLYETDPVLCTYLLLTEHSVARRMGPGYRTPITLLVEILLEGQKNGEVAAGDAQVQSALLFGALMRIPLFKHYGRVKGDLRPMAPSVSSQAFKMVASQPFHREDAKGAD